MTDIAGGCLSAVVAALNAGVTLAPVFSVPPEGTQPPVVIVGEINGDPSLSPKDGDMLSISVRIVTVVAGTSRAPLLALMAEVRAALKGAAISAPGVDLTRPIEEASSDRLDGINNVAIGDQSFLIFAVTASS